MKTKISYLLYFLFIQAVSLYAQDAQSRYNTGKELYKNGKYGAAMEALKPLLSVAEGQNYVQYSHYFYSLAALKAGKTEEARQIIKQLLLKFPQWEKKDEANYLLGNILFEQGKYKEALDALTAIGKDQKKDAEILKSFYLAKVKSLDTLKWLHQNFPKDKEVATSLAMQLALKCDNERDKMLLNYLIEEFRLDKEKLAGDFQTVKKKEYNVAVLFPFMPSRLSVENVSRPNQFLLDMYQGMRIAVDSLKKAGYKINLHAYDTEKDPELFKKLLAESEIKKMDLIVGPVYTAHLPVLSDFSLEHQIQVVNPFSSDLTLVGSNPLFFLFQPTYQLQAEALVSYIIKNNKPFERVIEKEKKGNKEKLNVKANEVVILFGESEKDSILAYSYREALMEKVAQTTDTFSISIFQKVNRESISEFKNKLSDSTVMTPVNHVVVFSSDQVIAANVISSMEIVGFDIPIFTTSEWLDFNLITIEQFQRRNVHYLYSGYLNYEDPDFNKFREKYLKKTHLYPTTFAFQGYDLMMHFGKALHDYGTYFSPSLQGLGYQPGIILAGINYQESNSNRFVPIVKFNEGKLEIVNTPE